MNLFKMSVPSGIKVRSSGWAAGYFSTMLSGLTGNLHELFYPFNTDCWLKKSFQDGGLEGWWPYEQAAYWLDGYIKCAYFSGDAAHFEKAKSMLDRALEIKAEDGFIGAKELRARGEGNQWVYAVFFRAILFLFDITGEKRYLDAVVGHYLAGASDYSEWRETVNVENMIMAYHAGGDEKLADMAVAAYKAHCANQNNAETKLADFLSDKPIKLHAVTYDEMVKIPALIYSVTGDRKYLDASLSGLDRIKKYHLLPIGIHSGCENFAGQDALACFEACDISDYCWSLMYIAQITGETSYIDEVERIMYNVAPSVMDKEFRTLQYFSSMNQVISTHNSNHSGSFTQTPRMAYQSDHYPECCTGNVNRSMPNFVYKAFMRFENGYIFNFYIPGTYEAGNVKFHINTGYPYNERVEIVYDGQEQNLQFKLRVPEWCKDFSCVCGQRAYREGGWMIVCGRFIAGDKILICLPSQVELIDAGEGYMVQKQPIAYTLKIRYKINIDNTESRQKIGFPAYDVVPVSDWQIALNKELFLKSFKYNEGKTINLLENDFSITAEGYLLKGVDLKKIHSSKVPMSDYDKQELVKLRNMGQVIYDGEMVFTPSISELAPAETERVGIELVPYSAAMLRWTIFPKI